MIDFTIESTLNSRNWAEICSSAAQSRNKGKTIWWNCPFNEDKKEKYYWPRGSSCTGDKYIWTRCIAGERIWLACCCSSIYSILYSCLLFSLFLYIYSVYTYRYSITFKIIITKSLTYIAKLIICMLKTENKLKCLDKSYKKRTGMNDIYHL